MANRPTVRTDGNSSNKMSDSLSDIKYTGFSHLQVHPQILDTSTKNINKLETLDRILKMFLSEYMIDIIGENTFKMTNIFLFNFEN